MTLIRYLAVVAVGAATVPIAVAEAPSEYAGSAACGKCHAVQFALHAKTPHSQALRKARATDRGPGSRAQWAFGAGVKAITWVSQTGQETIAEHGLTYYTSTKSLAPTPGHRNSEDIVYRTFDPIATALRCFRCHSTGPLTVSTGFQIQPAELGVQCEACHGPGREHAQSGGASPIQNPRRLTALQVNSLCGSCHRQASDLDDERDWSNAWNVRHQPTYLHRAACFRNSNGALSCNTCHEAHQPAKKQASYYDARCNSCHPKITHKTAIAARSCSGCHMPKVAANANLKFTNHWIGIYDPSGKQLIPSKRIVRDLQPSSAKAADVIEAADPSTLAPVYAMAVAAHERESGPESPKAARSLSDYGLFLLQLGAFGKAEPSLRRALLIAEHNGDAAADAAREALALCLEAQGKRDEALELFQRAAKGHDGRVASRSFAKMAELDPDNAESYYRSALSAEERASGRESPRVAVLLHAYSLQLRARNADDEAEPLIRRALSIQQATEKPDARVTVGLLNTLGNLLEGRRNFDEAEKFLRSALALSEEKFGPESPELATSCTYLADVLWNKKNLREAGQLFRRAITVNAAVYGPERPETAADIANLGMLMNEAGQTAAGEALLRQALAIYENTLGPQSSEARFVRERLSAPMR